MKYFIAIRAEMTFVHEIDAPSPEEARELAIQDILRSSEGDIYEQAYENFEEQGFDAWTIVEDVEDEEGKILQMKPWYSWE